MPSLEEDLSVTRIQENLLVFDRFDEETAYSLGSQMRDSAKAKSLGIIIDIRLATRPLYFAALPGVTPDNNEWARGKSNVVLRFHKSSWRMGLELKVAGTTVSDRFFVDAKDFRTHGGSFPIIVKGAGVIGAITVSGLPQRQDHRFVVKEIAKFLNHTDVPFGEEE